MNSIVLPADVNPNLALSMGIMLGYAAAMAVIKNAVVDPDQAM